MNFFFENNSKSLITVYLTKTSIANAEIVTAGFVKIGMDTIEPPDKI